MALNQVFIPKSNETKPAPVKEEPKPAANDAVPAPDDLITRATQFEIEKSPVNKSEDEIDAVLFSDKELRAKLDSIEDPLLREQFVNMRRSMMKGVNDKFQEIATLRKELQEVRANANRPKFSANSVEELLHNQEFVAEAQRISGKVGELANDETLSDAAKTEITKLKNELEQVKKSSEQQQTLAAQQEWQKHHDTLAQKYKNYDRAVVDGVAADLVAGRIKSTPEHLYKVIYHDENVKRAYEMGRREALEKIGEKKSISSIESVNAVQSTDVKQENAEDNKTFLQRIIANRLGNGAK